MLETKEMTGTEKDQTNTACLYEDNIRNERYGVKYEENKLFLHLGKAK